MRRGTLVAVVLFLAAAAPAARAEPNVDPPASVRAREAFERGAALVKQAKWAEALRAFEQSFEIHPHPVTLFNVGACERALGELTRARRAFLRARELDDQKKDGLRLPDSAKEDIDAFLREIASMLVVVDVHLEPETATLAVDGRPLKKTDADVPVFTAGLAPPGPGEAPGVATFRLELEPGTHLFVLTRPGFQDIVRKETFKRGDTERLDLTLARLDGMLDIRADRSLAAVSVDGVDVGTAPVTLKRPAGNYRVVVRKAGYVTFETEARLQAGGRVDLSAALPAEQQPITKTWWFWTAAGAVVIGATATTYFLTRPDPERPAANGGGLGWVLRAP